MQSRPRILDALLLVLSSLSILFCLDFPVFVASMLSIALAMFDVSVNCIGNEGAMALAEALKSNITMHTLDLTGVYIAAAVALWLRHGGASLAWNELLLVHCPLRTPTAGCVGFFCSQSSVCQRALVWHCDCPAMCLRQSSQIATFVPPWNSGLIRVLGCPFWGPPRWGRGGGCYSP